MRGAQVFKIAVGRLRPDFLVLCDPVVPANYQSEVGLEYAPFGPPYIECRNNNKDTYDARLSFPSGKLVRAELATVLVTGLCSVSAPASLAALYWHSFLLFVAHLCYDRQFSGHAGFSVLFGCGVERKFHRVQKCMGL